MIAPAPDTEERESALLDTYEGYRSSKHFAHMRTDGIRLVSGVGPSNARVMVVGDAPGAVENDSGIPFTGRSGPVLEKLMNRAGLTCHDTFLTTVVKYRTPGNRPPSAAEVMRSQKFLRREWLIVKPLLTIAVGLTAQAALAQEDIQHGIVYPFWYDAESGVYHKSTAVYHPSFALKGKKQRAWAEKEWSLLGEEIREFCPKALCEDCQGKGPRKGIICPCTRILQTQ